MPEFLVETYASYETPSAAAREIEEVSVAADRVSEAAAEVRLLRAIFVPEDELCFYLFDAASADAIRAAMSGAGVRFDRISGAFSAEPRQPVAEEES